MVKKTTVKSPSKKKTAAKKKKTAAQKETIAKNAMSAGPKQEVERAPAAETEPTPKKTTVRQKKASPADPSKKRFERWQPETLYSAPVDAAYQAAFAAPPRFEAGDARSREILNRLFDFDFAVVSKPPKKKRTLAELRALKFDRWQPETLYSAPVDAAYQAAFAAPPRLEADDSRSRQILKRKFDFDFSAVAKPPKKKRTLAELLALKFDRWQPETLYAAPADAAYAAAFAAPPRIEAGDARAREILNRKFDFDFAELAAKAEAERKAAEAKAAAEKAEAERKAAEAAALARKKADPVEKAIRYSVVCLAVVFTLIVAASFSNCARYYLIPKGDTVEIWKGQFSPAGEVRIAEIPAAATTSPLKDLYSKEEALTLAVTHALSGIDELFAKDVPDLEQIRTRLAEAEAFAFNEEYRKAVDARMVTVDLMTLLYRADAAAAKGTPADFEKALEWLAEAAALDLTENQALMVSKRGEAIQSILQAAEAKPAEVPKETAPETAAPEETPATEPSAAEKPETSI